MDIITNYENSSEITRNRVRKGAEDESFLSLFPQGFIIFQGKKQSLHVKLTKIKKQRAFFRIQAPYGEAAKAIEQPEIKASYLNSGDAYLLVTGEDKGKIYLWQGMGANEEEMKQA